MVLKWMDMDESHNLANGYGWIWISRYFALYGWIWIYLFFVDEYGRIWILQTPSMSISTPQPWSGIQVTIFTSCIKARLQMTDSVA